MSRSDSSPVCIRVHRPLPRSRTELADMFPNPSCGSQSVLADMLLDGKKYIKKKKQNSMKQCCKPTLSNQRSPPGHSPESVSNFQLLESSSSYLFSKEMKVRASCPGSLCEHLGLALFFVTHNYTLDGSVPKMKQNKTKKTLLNCPCGFVLSPTPTTLSTFELQ